MSADAPIIASAVVIPPNATQPSPPHRLKRRESSDPTNAPEDTGEAPAKRTRLGPARSIQDEKSRSQRLFGSILGNLGRVSQDNRTKKRLEVEAKMQEKMKAQQEEEKADIRRNREVKEEERKMFTSHAAQIRRRNESHMANFLVTRSKPKIYYRPWKLLRSQEILIEKQKEMAARNRSPSPLPTDRRRSSYAADSLDPISPTISRETRDNRSYEEPSKDDAEMHEDTTTTYKDSPSPLDVRQDTNREEEKARESSPVADTRHGDEEEEMVEY
ncbi:hypothetical protein H072_8046 [Dactylellina haptotyla CBS 200.50]|uniref:Pinin/SDK/MemA protein domain-containing protein n=1 Tax=Dactylellina haptotyla (strain CBS 200.50) TaxID=1284197 RepID=S8BGG5_DACHA|nr:hypothetical protein H072_8046 [Dactylellina haptotyla CBS 200.50]